MAHYFSSVPSKKDTTIKSSTPAYTKEEPMTKKDSGKSTVDGQYAYNEDKSETKTDKFAKDERAEKDRSHESQVNPRDSKVDPKVYMQNDKKNEKDTSISSNTAKVY